MQKFYKRYKKRYIVKNKKNAWKQREISFYWRLVTIIMVDKNGIGKRLILMGVKRKIVLHQKLKLKRPLNKGV